VIYSTLPGAGGEYMNRRIKGLITFIIMLCITLAITLSSFIIDYREYLGLKRDGWEKSGLKEQGMDLGLVYSAGEYLADESNACSLIVARHGKIVYERYYKGNWSNYNNIYGITKCVVAALIGAALQQGYIKDVNQPFGEVIGCCQDPGKNRGREITVKHLLTMTSGFTDKEYNEFSFNYTTEQRQKNIKHVELMEGVRAFIGSIEAEERFENCSTSYDFLSWAITGTTGTSANKFAYENIFMKLGISKKLYRWNGKDKGYSSGSGGIYMRPRDMAKLGQLYLDKGVWKGKQLLPLKWVEESTKVQVRFDNGEDAGFGYGWRITEKLGHKVFYAAGRGGQAIYVIPDLDIVVVHTIVSRSVDEPETGMIKDILSEYIIPAVKDVN